jgi:translation initiation factor 3 subunit M
MSTTIERVAEDDVVVELLQHVKKQVDRKPEELSAADLAAAGPVLETLLQQASAGNTPVALSQMIATAPLLSAMLYSAKEDEAENCFTITYSMVRKLPNDSADRCADLLTKFLTANTNSRPALRLRILSSVYNLSPATSARLPLFQDLLSYAIATKSTESLLGKLNRVDQWLEDWRASPAQRRTVYDLVRQVYLLHDQRLPAHRALVKQLGTYGSAGALPAEALDRAAEAALEAIRQPELFQMDDVFDLPAVRQLESSPIQLHSRSFQLMRIFTSDNLSAFNAFHAANPTFLADNKVSHGDSYKKIRLLSLASLAAQSHEIPYELIAQTLQIEAGEVETWVIAAIGAELLDARMDQVRRVVLVSRATQRVFADVQWKDLSGSLVAWRDNLSQILKVIRTTTARVQQAPAAAAGGPAPGRGVKADPQRP